MEEEKMLEAVGEALIAPPGPTAIEKLSSDDEVPPAQISLAEAALVPEVGSVAADGVRRYAEQLAAFVLATAEDHVEAAKANYDRAKQFSDAVREASEVEALRIISMTMRMQAAGLHLEEATRKFLSENTRAVVTKGNGP